MINNYQITKKMLLNKNHLVLLTTTYLMFLIEFQLSQYIGLNILSQQYDIEVQQINQDWLKDDILYNYILMYLSIRNSNIMLIYLNIFYLYIGILNITGDIDVIVDFHILYGLIVLSLKYEYILIEFSSNTILGICGCLYIRKVLYKLYKLYLN
tara:strand:+ start:68 stop:529 length:462 start_codon:yes stop_codon:yes gene_type:complete